RSTRAGGVTPHRGGRAALPSRAGVAVGRGLLRGARVGRAGAGRPVTGMRFLFPQAGIWMGAGFAAVALLRWRVRWRFAAFTAAVPLARLPRRASPLRRLPFAALAVAAAFASLAVMQPVLPFSPADLPSRGLDLVLLLHLSPTI